jgi:glycosyltransferase involved in cell wall biosynthesis
MIPSVCTYCIHRLGIWHLAEISRGRCQKEPWDVGPHVLYIGGEDHQLRIPAMLELRGQGFRVTAAASAAPGPFVQVRIPFYDFRLERFLNPLADWRTLNALTRLLADIHPDIVQSFDSKLSLLLPLAARKVRDVAVIRTINGRGWIYSSKAPLAMALRPVYRALHWIGAPFASATVFEIQEDHAFFERHNLLRGGRALQVSGAGVDVEGFEQALALGAPAMQLRQQLGLGDSQVVICVTRMTRQKGIPSLLKAAAMVNQKRPDVRFLLVGPRESEGPLAISEAEIARHAPYVIATGLRPDVPALLRLADVFAFPTEYREGVPRVLLEAALAGVPIVTTGIAGCSDVVRDGWNGMVAPPHAPAALAAKILEMLEHPQLAQTMAARARDVVKDRFSLSLVMAQQAALYRELIDNRSPGREEADTVGGNAAPPTRRRPSGTRESHVDHIDVA